MGKLGDIDTACVVLMTSSGKQAVILNSRRAAYGYDQRVEVFFVLDGHLGQSKGDWRQAILRAFTAITRNGIPSGSGFLFGVFNFLAARRGSSLCLWL